MCRQMPFKSVARLTGLSQHRAQAICERCVDLATADADLSGVRAVAIDETSRARGHSYVTVAADADERRVVFVGEGRGADAVGALAAEIDRCGGDAGAVESVSIDMSPAFVKGVAEHLPAAEATYDLRRLRLRGLIERIPRTRRYRVTDDGLRIAMCCHRTHARVLRPALSAVFDASASNARINRAIGVFDDQIARLWEGKALAA